MLGLGEKNIINCTMSLSITLVNKKSYLNYLLSLSLSLRAHCLLRQQSTVNDSLVRGDLTSHAPLAGNFFPGPIGSCKQMLVYVRARVVPVCVCACVRACVCVCLCLCVPPPPPLAYAPDYKRAVLCLFS